MSIVNKFRLGGRLMTTSLFYERTRAKDGDLSLCLFSIDGREKVNQSDGSSLINARKTFVELEDPTGYKWAEQYLESYDHFTRFLAASWFVEELDKWKEEIRIRLQSKSIDLVHKLLYDEDAPEGTRLSAAKYLAEEGWTKKQSKGRPSKQAVKAELKRETAKQKALREDAERIGLSLAVDNDKKKKAK